MTRNGTTGWKAAINCCPAFLQRGALHKTQRPHREAGRWAGGDQLRRSVLTAAGRAPTRLAATMKSLSCCRPMVPSPAAEGAPKQLCNDQAWALTPRGCKGAGQ